MKKQHILILLPLFTLLMLFFSCSHTFFKSTWQSEDFTVLHKSETSEPLRFFDPQSKLQYSFSNDKKNIYICIKATDEQSQIKIIRAGMTVGFDTLGKKEPQVKILFPFPGFHQKNNSSANPPKNNASVENKKDGHKSEISSMRKQFMSQYNEIHLSGFKAPIDGVLSAENNYGISVNIVWDTLNIMYYKAIIPFKTFYKDSLVASDTSKILGFYINVNALTMQHTNKEESGSQEGGMHGSGGMHGGGGGMHGGGMHGGGGHSGKGDSSMDDRSSLFQATTFMSRLKLAYSPQRK